MEYIIETRQLTKKYPAKLAVDHLDLHVNKGDIYGLIGKNGAGKTTAMKMLLGICSPTSGGMSLFGSEELNAERKKIGSLLESPGLYRNCTAYENMKRFSILYGGSDEEIGELLEFVGLADAGNRKVKQFSLGMKQRLGIALALLGGPELLVLDEPINGLDPAGIKEIRDLILKLNREKGVTFLISSHLLDELGRIATRFGVLRDGRLVEEIDASDLAQRCREGLLIRVADDLRDKAAEILKENGYTDLSIDEQSGGILVHGEIGDSGILSILLAQGGVGVREMTQKSNGIENYFIERLGR